MAGAIRIHKTGGPEVLSYETVEVPAPGPGEALIRHHACGVNFIDTYYRSGLYSPGPLPFVLGAEGAGEVLAVGEGVTNVLPGDRVAYAGSIGSYAQERLYPAARLVTLPAGIAYEQAAAMMLKGMTAQYLLRRTFRVEKGHTVLVQAAAGGVGLLLCQWAKALGATVIGTVGSEEKAALARANGADHTVLYKSEDWVKRVAELTGGEKCDVVYDGVGRDTYPGSLDCLKPLGYWVSFGNASGPVEPVSPLVLMQKGSLFMTRPTLGTYTAKREDLVATANELFAAVASGAITVPINQRYALKDARKAHEDLEGRATTGASVLIP
ncbi:quinone oxidoreductase family protein [Labrys wisconsinensis]|uniref:NADPH2:quinone reductase n=1 Tax=Labrys wisconsinensis TaxID=425677 RepID=A0ABU0J5A2_9HYPH|nr:quinone oxidoreductase [Labrys wisconsinensis]MDQ0469450.1 NADPH2:quinone reductase [Labrys wisconsinensis]